jgi:hypothetical protein
MTVGVVTDEPPELVSGGGDSSASSKAAELVAGNATADTDRVGKVEKAA